MNSMPGDIRRFVLAMPSIPHLEAILLLRGDPARKWDTSAMASYLYVSEDAASRIVQHLCSIGICAPVPDCPDHYTYRPEPASLNELIGRVAGFYTKNLIEVTNIIHANSGQDKSRKIQQFADAFKFRREE